MPIKIILIDDHFMIQQAVTQQLATESDCMLIAIGTSGEELEPLVQKHCPDVVLLDLGIPPLVGTNTREAGIYPVLPAVRRLRQQYSRTHFVILTASVDADLVQGALEAGAQGYLAKDDEASAHLPMAIRAVMQGGICLSESATRLFASRQASCLSKVLTERQLQVLQAVITNANLSYAQHAENLGISQETFSNHLREIYRKLGASNLTFAVLEALRLGLIPPSTPKHPPSDDVF